MKIYLAAQYPRRDELRVYRDALELLGIHVTSRWLNEQEPLNGNFTTRPDSWYYETARVDLEDITEADAILFFAEDPTIGIKRGGRHVEFGYALAQGKPIYVVTPYKENVFHYNDKVFHVESVENFISLYIKYAHE